MLRRLIAVAVAAFSLLSVDSAEGKRRSSVSGNTYTQGGYASRPSVAQGGSIGLHIATSVPDFPVRIINLAEPQVTLRTLTGLQSRSQDCGGRYEEGCAWDVTTVLDIPSNWRSGYYAAVFPTFFGERYLPFIVREDDPGSASNVVVLASTHTWQAYNDFGSRSTYPSTSPWRSRLVSYERPYSREHGLGRYGAFERPFVDWMTAQRRAFEVITDVDLEDPAVLSRYDVLVIPGHSEYWTASARTTVEAFSRAGGHIALLNGNTMWWQVRLEQNDRVLAVYKSDPADPHAAGPQRSTHFFEHPVNRPENHLVGTSFRNGGYVNRIHEGSTHMKPVAERLPWTVTDGEHWIYAGTGLRDGDTFGKDTTGLEVDGVVFNCDAQGRVLGPDGSDEAPLHYEILAVVPASDGWGTLGLLVHPSGGAVFNAATNSWPWALQSNPVVARITTNVLDRLSTGAPLPYQPVESTILAQDLFNCAQPIPSAGWESSSKRTRFEVTPSCAYEGPAGLELAGETTKAIVRHIAPRGGESRSDAHLRFYLNADALQQRTTYPMTFVVLEERTGNSIERPASVEIDATGGKRIRVARRPSAGGYAASPWIALSDGWQLVEVSWRSPGTMTLQVDGGSPVSLEVADSDQRVNRVMLTWPAPELTAAGRVCMDAFAAGSTKPGPVTR